ncbi:hypothetical protein LPJ53_001101 [Coemansia erecta]|uniref:RRM domain-containing protein n=1 Tax=Coemansia erecta TaxID=147472 RepID=A0A9W7Y657_9FUNG|nr:hypothetical protein LPJ53_001101 [Coemansia erecta]
MSSAKRLYLPILRRCSTSTSTSTNNTIRAPHHHSYHASALASIHHPSCLRGQRRLLLSHTRYHSSIPTHPADSEHQLMQQQQQRQHPGSARSPASDISPTPTVNVRLSNLPPGTALSDIRHAIATTVFQPRIKSIHFEYDQNLRPLRSCRVVLYNVADATEFLVHANKKVYASYAIKADFVIRSFVPNATRDSYLGNAVGRLVLLYGYPRHMHEHQIRSYYRDYDLVDATIPAVQPAPQTSHTFLTRRGAFILHFATPSEAQRFVRDIHMTEYIPWSSDTTKRSSADSESSPSPDKDDAPAAPASGTITLKAMLI